MHFSCYNRSPYYHYSFCFLSKVKAVDFYRTFWDAIDSVRDLEFSPNVSLCWSWDYRLGTNRNIVVSRKLLRLKVVTGSTKILEIKAIARMNPPTLPRQSSISYVVRLIVRTLWSKNKSMLENLYLPFGSIDGWVDHALFWGKSTFIWIVSIDSSWPY